MLGETLASLLNLRTPVDPLHNDGYQFWSGIGSGSPILLGIAVWWRKHNCHVHRCPWFTWKEHNGHWLCRKHHPDDPPTAENIGQQ